MHPTRRSFPKIGTGAVVASVLGFPSITNDLQGRTLNHAEYLASRADIRVDSTRNTAIRN